MAAPNKITISHGLAFSSSTDRVSLSVSGSESFDQVGNNYVATTQNLVAGVWTAIYIDGISILGALYVKTFAGGGSINGYGYLIPAGALSGSASKRAAPRAGSFRGVSARLPVQNAIAKRRPRFTGNASLPKGGDDLARTVDAHRRPQDR